MQLDVTDEGLASFVQSLVTIATGALQNDSGGRCIGEVVAFTHVEMDKQR